MSFGVRAPSPGTGSWGSEAPPAPPGTEPSRGLPGGGCCPGAGYLAAGPAAVASLARAALRTVGSWEVWTGCPSLPRLVPQAPLRVPGRKALRVLQGEENAGRRPPEKPTTSGQVHGAAAARRLSRCRPPHPSPRPPTPPLCLPHSPPRGPRLGRSFFPGRPGCSRTLCIPGATDRADSTGVCGPGGGGPGPMEPHGRSDLRGRLQLPGAPGLPDGPGLGAASLPRPPPSPRGLASVCVSPQGQPPAPGALFSGRSLIASAEAPCPDRAPSRGSVDVRRCRRTLFRPPHGGCPPHPTGHCLTWRVFCGSIF